MPELPEVTTIVNELKAIIIGEKIDDVEVRLDKIIRGDIGRAIGQKITGVERRAKLIIIRLTEDNLAIHLKMTGQLFFLPAGKEATVTGEKENKFTHVIFHLADGSRLLFNDVRQFGYVKLLNHDELNRVLAEDYGIEPVSAEFTLSKFTAILKKRPKMRLKPLLTDQTIIAGIGNIYADEALWEAKLHPLTKAGSLTDQEVSVLYRSIKLVLAEAIKWKGTSMDDYRRTTGEQGEYAAHRRVYRRTGEPCPRCKTPVVRITLGGRGTHFCPKEQIEKH